MIAYESFELSNGLRVLVHEDPSLPICAFNLVYDVGSKDENPERTGFAHLFEHLMFEGSQNITEFDKHLERVGGSSNAFTSTDITNYYFTLPSVNLETAFWLESDRMLSLAFSPEGLEVQRKVVIEEFKQRYFNQPYGDAWLHLRPLAYKVHPYNWLTIGKEIAHIEQATLEDVKNFFYKHYRPCNAVLCVAGDCTLEQVKVLSEKWFGPIESGTPYKRNLPKEPVQTEARSLTVKADVPVDVLYKVYHMCERLSPDYHPTDLLSDILGRGESSRLYQEMVKDKEYFTSIQASITGSNDAGLFILSAQVSPNVSAEEANKALEECITRLVAAGVDPDEVQKVKNQAEASFVFSEVQLLNRAMNLSFYALMGDPNRINTELDLILAVTKEDIDRVAKEILRPENCSTLFYLSEKKEQAAEIA